MKLYSRDNAFQNQSENCTVVDKFYPVHTSTYPTTEEHMYIYAEIGNVASEHNSVIFYR
jgi:hypothetical protein